MKHVIVLIVILFTNSLFSQQKSFTKYDPKSMVFVKNEKESKSQEKEGEEDSQAGETMPQLEADAKKYGSINESISFGLSLGFNNTLENLKLAQISPIDNTLIISNAQKTSFVLSTAVSVPIFYNKRKAYRLLDKTGSETGQVHKISEWSIIGVVNLLTFSEAESGNVFNQKISGGLGVSYSLSPDFAIGLSYELISYRKPKNFLIDLNGQEVQSNGTTIESIELSDNDYYFDRYAGTVAFKIIYKLTKS